MGYFPMARNKWARLDRGVFKPAADASLRHILDDLMLEIETRA
jgi:hypothetical protein